MRQSPYSVNWLTARISPPTCATERFIFPSSSSNILSATVFRARWRVDHDLIADPAAVQDLVHEERELAPDYVAALLDAGVPTFSWLPSSEEP